MIDFPEERTAAIKIPREQFDRGLQLRRIVCAAIDGVDDFSLLIDCIR
jgi:hypothetical protein